MSNFGPAPSRITAKISPSLDPRSHLSSVRLGGCVPSGAIGPSPLASAPWQKRQFFWNSACPALIDAGDEAIGFFNFRAAARVLRHGTHDEQGDAGKREHRNEWSRYATHDGRVSLLLKLLILCHVWIRLTGLRPL